MKEFLKCYYKELEKLKNDKNNIAIFQVGSSKNLDFTKLKENIKDIDIFIISEQIEEQIRYTKTIYDIELDINKFSIKHVDKMIESKEYFFINEMKDAKIIYDRYNMGKNVINLSKIKYEEGPEKISKENLLVISTTIYDNISRLKEKDKFENYEYEFLTNIYLKDIIKGYFIINSKWIPKDKKIFKYLSENEKDLFKLAKKVCEDYNYYNLEKVYKYVFND
ncbi:hypothetical protein [Paraclostridium bifermentans]|uniref:hypothetical protein n=1 Tax=Paraclostridium bifermentans TaxID=1490 RepID=UPI00359C147F